MKQNSADMTGWGPIGFDVQKEFSTFWGIINLSSILFFEFLQLVEEIFFESVTEPLSNS